jgi:Gene product 88
MSIESEGARSVKPLVRGNAKLGGSIWAFNLPAVVTCPGRSAACQDCYALQGHWTRASVKKVLAARLHLAESPEFVTAVVLQIGWERIKRVRIHASGDFYSADYIAAWHAIASSCPTTRFYAYTRSWRVPELAAALAELAALPNVKLFLSADNDTGKPPRMPRTRVAWLQSAPGDAVPRLARRDVVFRTRRARRVAAKRIGLALVCPVENGSPAARKPTCGSCRFCWEGKP